MIYYRYITQFTFQILTVFYKKLFAKIFRIDFDLKMFKKNCINYRDVFLKIIADDEKWIRKLL